MRIIFMGTPTFSVPILKSLHETYGVTLVVTQPDSPVGRKRILTPSPVKTYAIQQNIPVFQPTSIRNDYHLIVDHQPDLIITAAYGQIIPKILLNLPAQGAINVHASLLPELRGGAPIQRAIERRFKETGVTIMTMVPKMDAGDIIAQRRVPLDDDETAGSLFDKLSYVGRDLLMDTLPSIMNGSAKKTPQDDTLVTYAYNIKREEEQLDFSQSAYELDAKIRAFYPEPNTYTTVNGHKLKVIQARVHLCGGFIKNHLQDENGIVLRQFDDGVGIKCQDAVLVLTEVQLAGKKAMPASIFMQGIGRTLLKKGVVIGKNS